MVTRETSISAGLHALGLTEYASRGSRLAEYAEILVTDARDAGLIGKREADRVVERHVLESCALIPYLNDTRSLLDVGSGAGLPGIPIGIATGLPVVMVESRARASTFLRTAAAQLGVLGRVVQASAEEAARTELRDAADAVVARALAPPPVALELTLPFARPGRRVVALVGPSAPELASATATAARELGGADPSYVSLEVPGTGPGLWVMIVDKVVPTPERYPRRPGIPRRRPLGGGVTGVV